LLLQPSVIGVGIAIKIRNIGLDIQQGCTVKCIHRGGSYNAFLYRFYPDNVHPDFGGPEGASAGEYTYLFALVTGGMCSKVEFFGTVEIEQDNQMAELLELFQPFIEWPENLNEKLTICFRIWPERGCIYVRGMDGADGLK
jgi:hypothetical protein